MQKVVIVGAGQNGYQAYNILKLDRRVSVIGFLDDNVGVHGSRVCGQPVLGGTALIGQLRHDLGVEGAIVAIGNNRVRREQSEKIRQSGVSLIKAIHPHTFIDDTAQVGDGVIVEMGVMIHPEARIGHGVFLGGSSVVAHHCVVGDYTLIGGGVIFGGGVTVGDSCTLGVGTVLQPQIKIGDGVTTGIGSAVIKELPSGAVAVGVPAKVIRMV